MQQDVQHGMQMVQTIVEEVKRGCAILGEILRNSFGYRVPTKRCDVSLLPQPSFISSPTLETQEAR